MIGDFSAGAGQPLSRPAFSQPHAMAANHVLGRGVSQTGPVFRSVPNAFANMADKKPSLLTANDTRRGDPPGATMRPLPVNGSTQGKEPQ